MWQNAAITEIATLPLANPSEEGGEAAGINDQNQIVGWPYDQGSGPQLFSHAVVWQNGHITDLNGLLNAIRSEADGINNNGAIVGQYENTPTTPFSAFLYQQGVMTDINTLLPQGSGWTVSFGDKINDRGEMIVQGLNSVNSTNWILLSPNGL